MCRPRDSTSPGSPLSIDVRRRGGAIETDRDRARQALETETGKEKVAKIATIDLQSVSEMHGTQCVVWSITIGLLRVWRLLGEL